MKKILILLLTTIIFSGCSDDFLTTVNKNTLDTSSFLKTENDVSLATNAAYTPLAYTEMFGLNYLKVFNSLDPYMWFEGQNGYDIMNFGPVGDIKGFWVALYQGLMRTSDILMNMENLRDVIPAQKFVQYEGQLKALRGMYYFYLVTLYDKAVYYDETNIPTDPLEPRTNGTQEEFWNKLEEDLTFAAANLPASWAASETGRITKGGASAMLGKALLYKHYHYYLRFGKGNTTEAKENLKKSKEALNAVITSGNYHLIQPIVKDKSNIQAALLCNFSYLDIPVGSNLYKSENNAESVWEIQYNDEPGWNIYLPAYASGGNSLYGYFSPLGGSYKNMMIDPELWKQFETVSGNPAGYTVDPRAYATCYIDGDLMDWRPESGYNIPFVGNVNAKPNMYPNLDFAGLAGITNTTALGLKKYYYPQFTIKSSPMVAPVNVRVIRYSDVLLMYAEACLQYDNDADGTGLIKLNEVRSRVDMPAISSLTPASIKHERDVELASEGHHYNDIIRWSYDPAFGIDFNALFNGRFDTNKHMYFPIPQSEIDVCNGSLKQNPGW